MPPFRHSSQVACTFDPLSEADSRTVDGIMNEPRIKAAMALAWQRAQDSPNNHEFGFLIYYHHGNYHASQIFEGDAGGVPAMATYFTRQFAQGMADPDANFHIHPGDDPRMGMTDGGDERFNMFSNSIGIILSAQGFQAGRLCHE